MGKNKKKVNPTLTKVLHLSERLSNSIDQHTIQTVLKYCDNDEYAAFETLTKMSAPTDTAAPEQNDVMYLYEHFNKKIDKDVILDVLRTTTMTSAKELLQEMCITLGDFPSSSQYESHTFPCQHDNSNTTCGLLLSSHSTMSSSELTKKSLSVITKTMQPYNEFERANFPTTSSKSLNTPPLSLPFDLDTTLPDLVLFESHTLPTMTEMEEALLFELVDLFSDEDLSIPLSVIHATLVAHEYDIATAMLSIYYAHDPIVQGENSKRAAFNADNPLPSATLSSSPRKKYPSTSQHLPFAQSASSYAARVVIQTPLSASPQNIANSKKSPKSFDVNTSGLDSPAYDGSLAVGMRIDSSCYEPERCREDELYWRTVASDGGKLMKAAFHSAAQTRSAKHSESGYEYRNDMVVASCRAAQFALRGRNPHIVVGSNDIEHLCLFLGIRRNQRNVMIAGVKSSMERVLKIDLHGLFVREALLFIQSILDYFKSTSVKEFIDYVMESQERARFIIVIFVVGKGNNSVNNIARLGPAVAKLLSAQQVSFTRCGEGEMECKLRVR